jgi:large subunit ribosomal protein L18
MINKLENKLNNRLRRKNRVRAKVHGTADRPRLSVSVSNHHVSAQIINDENGSTVASSTTVGNKKLEGTMSEKATYVGTDIAKKAAKAKIKAVVFDRNGRIYHGRIKALAEAARAEGLEF